MTANWGTFYREASIANDAKNLLGPLWVKAEPSSELETLLRSVMDYLDDRFTIEIAFCNLIIETDQ